MNDDPRCCGSGTCIIDADGRCWCGQQWNGETMCPPSTVAHDASPSSATPAAPGTHPAGHGHESAP